MVKFLIYRPIAVSMIYLALLTGGLISLRQLPVSLMPDIDIPEITVQVSYAGVSARELEGSVVSLLRNQLMQVSYLDDIHSETRNGEALIRLRFKFGTALNDAYLETSEKMDAALQYLPRDMERPRIVKASVSDIPVFYLDVFRGDNRSDTSAMLALSEFTEQVIRRRVEQLPEVAMADISGLMQAELHIIPDLNTLHALNLSVDDIEQAVREHSLQAGSFRVSDGQLMLTVRFSSVLRTSEDVKKIHIRQGGRVFTLGELARVETNPAKETGMCTYGEYRSVKMAIIKQADTRMYDLSDKLDTLLVEFRSGYPELRFAVSQDQSQLLKLSIQNLTQSLWLGSLLAFLVLFFFLRNVRSPLLIGITIPASLLLSMLAFSVFGMSLNIISLSGLVLGVGMMIDNSIIVIDTISQYREKGYDIDESCSRGTNDVIIPLLSSALTTSVIFAPLIFAGGIAGSLFFDQAMAVSIGLAASYVVSITLLPVYFKLSENIAWLVALRNTGSGTHTTIYESGFRFVFSHRRLFMIFFVLAIGSTAVLWQYIPRRMLPELEQHEWVVKIDWNEQVSVYENNRRVQVLMASLSDTVLQYTSQVGSQQFLLQNREKLSITEILLYLRTDPGKTEAIKTSIINRLQDYPKASSTFNRPPSVFEQLFDSNEPVFEARISSTLSEQVPVPDVYYTLKQAIYDSIRHIEVSDLAMQPYLQLQLHTEKLLLYEVNQSDVLSLIRTTFNENRQGELKSYTRLIPIVIGQDVQGIDEWLQTAIVYSTQGEPVPLRHLVSISLHEDYKTLFSGKDGEYLPLRIETNEQITQVEQKLKQLTDNRADLQLSFAGSYYKANAMSGGMLWILLVSVLLLYFILAAQFESFIQPFVVLLELPADIAAALFLLWLFGSSINLMSAIGIVVMSGIIINDSILKLDLINRNRSLGMPLLSAIEDAGHRRLNSILMTSMTTILALVPLFFTSGMGSELQRPLALALIGGMTLGTAVSLYIIPLLYYYIYKNS